MRFPAFYAVLAAVTAALLALPAFAADYNPKMQEVSDLNHTDPLQSPKFERMENVIDRHVLDRKNKVVGTVKDIILNDNGNIASINVSFDRLQLNRPVYVDYTRYNITPASNGYAMSFDSGEIQKAYPGMLADIETAAGDDQDKFSLDKIKGLEVWNDSGRRIGTINDVLFSPEGKRAEAVYITLSEATLNTPGIAVPFREVNLEGSSTTHKAIVADTLADAMVSFAKGQ